MKKRTVQNLYYKSDMSDNSKAVGNDAELEDITEMTIDI